MAGWRLWRQRALGEPLRPYVDRVDAALKRVLASRQWAGVQRQWLEPIGKQMRLETVFDRGALDGGAFKHRGGPLTP